MEETKLGIFRENDQLYTENAFPGEKVYGENLISKEGSEFREWNPNRSKAAAAVMNGFNLGVKPDDEMLYLGAASGTTVSHFSDILDEGFIVAVEYSQEVARKLVGLSEQRGNIAPVIADARKPEDYQEFLDEVDIVYQDISQSDQAEIFIKNCREYLKDDGIGLLAVKAQSISSTQDPQEIFEEVKDKLKEEFRILDEVELKPYEKDHLFLKLEKK